MARTSKHEKEQRLQQEARERKEERMSSIMGSIIRETAYALGLGNDRVSLDGGSSWHPKRGIVCEGGHPTNLTVRASDGSWVSSDMGTFIDCNMRRQDCVAVEKAEGRLRKIYHAVKKANGIDSPMLGADWLWCIIVLTEGDVVLG